MSNTSSYRDSIAFRNGMRLMRHRIGELLRERRSVVQNIHLSHLNRTHSALATELTLLINKVDSMPLDVDADS